MAPKLTTEERARMVDLLKEHEGNRNRVAKIVGRHASTVGRVAAEEGIESGSRNIAATQKANEARSLFAEIDRNEVIADILTTGRTLLKNVKEPRDYKDVVTGLAIGIDKHLLVSGEATSRSDSRHQHRTLDLSQATAEELDEFERIVGGSR